MSIADRKIKNIEVRVKDSSGKIRTINLIEHDIVNLKFKSPDTGKIIQIETGEIIKIGVNGANSTYLTIFSYNYNLENNLFYVPTNSLTQVISVNHSSEQYTLTPIYSSDESVAVLRSSDNCLEYTVNGKDWIKCGGGGGSDITIDDVDREIEKYLVDYPSDEEVDTKISEAVAGFVTGEEVDTKISEATADFVTETQVGSIVDEKVAEATADFVTESEVTTIVDEKVAEATADFVTGEEVDTKISEATTDFVTESTVIQIVDQATADFVTESQVTTIVDEKVAEATADFVTSEEVDTKISEATVNFVTGEEVDTKISEATADFVTESTVVQIVDQATADFVTETQVDTKISEAVADFVTEAQVAEQISEATVNFVTGEEVDTKISEAVADFVTNEELNDAIKDFVTLVEVDNEIADALVNYAPLVGPEFSGDVKIPTVSQSVDSDIAASTSYVRTAINDLKDQLSGALHFKGSVETIEDLENIENPSEGDVYQVMHTPTGESAEFVYTADGTWIELGTIIDLSAYATRDEMTSAISAAVESANQYTDEKVAAIDPYVLASEKGYLGTKDQFYEALAEVLNTASNIVINEQV